MTNEELIEYMKENNCCIIPRGSWVVDGINMFEAIEKQKPKKPQYSESSGYYCPVCGNYLFGRKWCCECGQKVDWSENND